MGICGSIRDKNKIKTEENDSHSQEGKKHKTNKKIDKREIQTETQTNNFNITYNESRKSYCFNSAMSWSNKTFSRLCPKMDEHHFISKTNYFQIFKNN